MCIYVIIYTCIHVYRYFIFNSRVIPVILGRETRSYGSGRGQQGGGRPDWSTSRPCGTEKDMPKIPWKAGHGENHHPTSILEILLAFFFGEVPLDY